jgi:hypothetical protein
VLGGQSTGAWRTVHVLPADGPFFSGFAAGGSVRFNGQFAALAGRSAVLVRTVRPSWPDGPPEPGCFVSWFDSSLLSFVLPCVLQGIVPKT